MKLSEQFLLNDKTAVVTGALGLIGRQHCIALADAGANVVVCDLDRDACEEFAAQLPTWSTGVMLDITDVQSVKALRTNILQRYGHIDVLVNNAAINDMVEQPINAPDSSKRNSKNNPSMFENYPVELFRKVLDVNITGMFISSQVLGAEMAKQGGGSIINIASTYGIVAPDQSLYMKPDGSQKFFKSAVYPAAKGAVISFTRFLATYWGKNGVRVNTLSPGGVENGQDEFFIQNYSRKTPLGRMAAPEDYRGAVVFLASDASSYMTGANLVVDGGWTAW